MADPLRFFLAGSTGLLAECGRRLLDAGQSVVAVWAPDPATIPGFLVGAAGPGTLPEALARAEFDYLLSVANPCLLGPEALARARCGAINYHDAPLPRFAGRHAAPRAILRGESTHGVTWHQMVPRVDAGAILVQEVFPVDPEETSFSLHLKCFEAALRTFDRLLEGLRAGTLVSVPQDLTRRTWFSSTDRLPDQGRLRWDLPARELSARVRSADFGPEPNDWGTCWFEGPEGPVQVGMLQVDLLPRVAPAGAILEVGPREVTVASADLPVRLGRLQGADLGSPAWVVVRGPVDAVSLRQGLLGDLPEWMVPSGVEVVEDLPRTVAGKVDRRALVDRAGRVPAVAALEDRDLRTMLGLWREVLGRSEVGPDWDFFDQGGDSLTALRLCSRLQGWRGRPVPLPALARARTPRALLEALGRPQTCRYLQPLSAARDGPVRAFVHPLGGSAEVYRGLAALLPGPAIGFQAMQEPEHPSVEEMARRYLEELLAYQPDGPYCLAGLSLGGLVAFEMACRLEAAGKAVERLAVIDTVVPGHGTPIPWVGGSRRLQGLLRGGQRLAHHLGTLMRQRPGDRLPYLRRLVRRSGAAGKGIGTTRRESGVTPAVPTSARGDYQPGFFPGELLLVRVRHQTPLLRVDRALGWTDHARAVRAVEVPGLHGTSLLEPPLVEAVAAALAGRA